METNTERLLRLLLVMTLGQSVSLFLATTTFSSSLIANMGVNAPLLQCFPTYSSLALVFGTVLLVRRQKLQVTWYWYLLLGFVDVQGNFLVVSACQYTSITSVALLDCWTIPWVIILTWFFLGTRYSIWQCFGAAICIIGLGLVLISDTHISSGGGKNPLLGDALVVAGTFFHALSNVGEEYCAKRKGIVEVLAMLGVVGMLVCMCEIILFEEHVRYIKWSLTLVVPFAGFAVAAFLFYLVAPFTLKMGGSTLFNLSLLTSDAWVVAIRIFFYHQQVDWLYFVALAVVGLGLIIYSLSERSVPETAVDFLIEDDEIRKQYEALKEDDGSINQATVAAI